MKLEINNACCGYSHDNPILKNISFLVETGEICCLLGSNGVGKTTLFKSILGLTKLLSGEISIDGEDISKWSAKKRSKAMAYVSQAHVPPFPFKVKDVVILGRIAHIGYFGQPSKYDYEFSEEIMNEMGIFSIRNKEYTDISGGERQLVMIARALVQEPDFLVLDEPTANLDFGNTIKVLKHLMKLNEKELGIIMTTHSPDQVFLCGSKTALLNKDKSFIFGNPNEVITQKNLMSAYGADIRIIEYTNENGKNIKICVPFIE